MENYFSAKMLLLLLGAFLLAFSYGYAQPLPGKRPLRQPAQKTIAKPQPRTTAKPPKTEPVPIPQVEQKDDTPPEQQPVGDENNPEQPHQLEARNTIRQKGNGDEAMYYRMDHSSISVLPVIISVPGLHETTSEGKPVYQPSELFRRQSVKPLVGDVLVSVKHYYNKVKFDTDKLFIELLRDSTTFYELTGLKSTSLPRIKKETKSKPITSASQQASTLLAKKATAADPANTFGQTESPLAQKIRESLVAGNVGTNVLKIWTNKVILMNRIMLAQDPRDKRQRIDPKKLAVWEKLLRKNYILVLALLEPHKKVTYINGKAHETNVASARGFLYHVDTTRLNINAIANRHPLQFVGSVSMPEMSCDPRSEEIIELTGAQSITELQNQVKKMTAASLRPLADQFYREKSYQCAKNYYEYMLSSAPSDSVAIQKKIEICTKQLARNNARTADNTCLANETALFQDWVYAQSATNELLQECERNVADLQVHASIIKTKPYITAEIGRKQGTYIDQRYLVYRKTIDKNGNVGQERIGTLRVVKIGNNLDRFPTTREQPTFLASLGVNTASLRSTPTKRNTSKAASKPSSLSPRLQARQAQQRRADSLVQEDLKTMSIFKQTDGIRIQPFDLIRQNDDYGVGFQVGYGKRLGVPAFSLGADIRLAQIIKSRVSLPGLKLGANLVFPDKKQLTKEWDIPADKSTIIELYLARELYLSPKFDIKPFAGTSIFNSSYQLLLGMAGSVNLVGRNSNTKVRLVPEVGYVSGYTYQANLNLKFDF
ncbi:hypothetical protein GCM10028810_51470 [Spirosoma litoris]